MVETLIIDASELDEPLTIRWADENVELVIDPEPLSIEITEDQ